MPAPEWPDQSKEPRPEPYQLASHFPNEQSAGRAYFAAQEAIFEVECDLSTFRFQLNRVYHVAVVGEPPPEALERSLRRILAAGEPTSLPTEVFALLQERRARAIRQGPWIERHHRPGQPL